MNDRTQADEINDLKEKLAECERRLEDERQLREQNEAESRRLQSLLKGELDEAKHFVGEYRDLANAMTTQRAELRRLVDTAKETTENVRCRAIAETFDLCSDEVRRLQGVVQMLMREMGYATSCLEIVTTAEIDANARRHILISRALIDTALKKAQDVPMLDPNAMEEATNSALRQARLHELEVARAVGITTKTEGGPEKPGDREVIVTAIHEAVESARELGDEARRSADQVGVLLDAGSRLFSDIEALATAWGTHYKVQLEEALNSALQHLGDGIERAAIVKTAAQRQPIDLVHSTPRDLHLRWNGTEWVDDRCGCRYHPDDDGNTHGGAPHVHPCLMHRA